MHRLTDGLKEKNIPCRTGVITASLCSFRIGGVAALLVEPQCVGELIEAVALCKQEELPYYIVGKGSNLLFPDGEISTVLIRTVALDAVRETADGFDALCGTPLQRLSYLAAKRGMRGLEFASGIPGTLGGGVYMNAGAYGGALSDVIKSVRYYDPANDKIKTDLHFQLSFSYRKSKFQANNCLILSAELTFGDRCDPQALLAKMRAQNRARALTQPLEVPSAGSSFRRLDGGIPLARTIDELGLKGFSIGGAQVSTKHANFIINTGNAKATDVTELINHIERVVKKERGIVLQEEVQVIGDREAQF